jgi:hypothetical protein
MPEEHGITAIENTAANSALLFLSNQRLFGLKKPLVWTVAQSCSALKLTARVSPLVLYSYRNEIHVVKLSHCMKLFLDNQRLLDCCSIVSILYVFVHSLQKEHIFPSIWFSLEEACYRDWHTFGIPEIWFGPLSMKKPLKNRIFF